MVQKADCKTMTMQNIDNNFTFNEMSIIEILYDCMNIIQAQLSNIDEESKKELYLKTTVMWQTADNNDTSDLYYNVSRAVAYIIVDQLLFYDLLQRHNTSYKFKKLEPLRENESPKDLYDNYMQQVITLTGDYKPIFSFDLLSLLPKNGKIVDALNECIKKITGLNLPASNTDFIGKIFHKMIPSEIRKGLAAYYTSSSAALLLARLAITKPEAKVCDLACGSGTLLVESYHVKRDLYRDQHPEMSEDEVHNKMLTEEIYGNDITLFASHLAAMNLVSQNLGSVVNRINITSTDGLKINANGKERVSSHGLLKYIPNNEQIRTKTIDMGMDTNDEIIFPTMDCVVMNPPFSRSQNMSKEMKDNIDNITQWWFSIEDKDKYIDKRMGLHCYFVIHADHLLEKGGVIAMVLPASTFLTNYGKKIKRYLKNKKYRVDVLMQILSDTSAFSEDCKIKEYIIVCTKGMLKYEDNIKVVTIKDSFELHQVNDILKSINETKSSELVSVQVRTIAELYNSKKWSEIFLKSDARLNEVLSSSLLQNYKDSDIRIVAGYSSSYSDYLMLFELTENEIEIIKKQKKEAWSLLKLNDSVFRLDYISPNGDQKPCCSIPAKFLVPAIRSSDTATKYYVEPDCWVLSLPPELPPELSDFERTYIKWAEKKLDARWEQNRRDGHRRIDIVKKVIKRKDKFGRTIYLRTPWFNHAQRNGCETLQTNFLIKQYSLTSRKTFSMYSSRPASVNGSLFYVKDNNDKFMASWLASGIYIMSMFLNHQIISKDYCGIRTQDFDNVKFPRREAFSDDVITELVTRFELIAAISDEDMPTLLQQLGDKKKLKDKEIEETEGVREPLRERVELDNAWLRALGVDETEIDETRVALYDWLIEYIQSY